MTNNLYDQQADFDTFLTTFLQQSSNNYTKGINKRPILYLMSKKRTCKSGMNDVPN